MLGELRLPGIGRRLARVDQHLLDCIRVRVGAASLSDLVAEAKRSSTGPIFPILRKSKEDERIGVAATIAEDLGLDPDFAAALQMLLIEESCRTQAAYMHEHQHDRSFNPKDPEQVFSFQRDQLLALTAAVAAEYETEYIDGSFATKSHYDFEWRLIQELIEQIDDRSLALDLGCATGWISRNLAAYFDKVVGYDISLPMLTKARELCKSKPGRVSFLQSDLEGSIDQEDNSVSLVVMNLGTGSEVRNMSGLLAEINRVLKPDGRFFLSFYNSDSLTAKLGFLPWSSALSANIDPERHCLDVHLGTRVYVVYARSYSRDEITAELNTAGLTVEQTQTHPTISSIMPEVVLSSTSLEGWEEQPKVLPEIDPRTKEPYRRRWCRAVLEPSPNKPAREALLQLDDLAAKSSGLGAYLMLSGKKGEAV